MLMLVLVQVELLLPRHVWQSAWAMLLGSTSITVSHFGFVKENASVKLGTARFQAHQAGHLSCTQAAPPVFSLCSQTQHANRACKVVAVLRSRRKEQKEQRRRRWRSAQKP
jgi:hypothetical protein